MNVTRLYSIIAIASLASGAARAQNAPPGTDIYLVPLSVSGRAVSLGTPTNITARAGYDNQPFFSPDSRSIYYTSVRGDGQSDIYRYDIDSHATARVTSTPESEYSPTVMAGGARFSTIRVERDSTQRLWSFALDGSDPRLVLERIKPVGYHAWLGDGKLALFVLGNPATLQIADSATGRAQIVAGDIGRVLTRTPDGHGVTFVQEADSTWWLMSLDLTQWPRAWSIERLVQMPPKADYAVWLPDGTAIAAAGSSLYRWRRGDATWEPAVDLSRFNLSRLSRIAISPDGTWIALVGADATR